MPSPVLAIRLVLLQQSVGSNRAARRKRHDMSAIFWWSMALYWAVSLLIGVSVGWLLRKRSLWLVVVVVLLVCTGWFLLAQITGLIR